jgi:hypothetical protein
MYLQQSGQQYPDSEAPDIYTFRREEGIWYIHLPAYLEQGWSKTDLQMVEGAHKFLNRIANGTKKVRLRLCTTPVEGAAMLALVEHCDAPRGGAIYNYQRGKDQTRDELFWICDLALLVFGDLPERIYVQRLPAKEKRAPNHQSQAPLTSVQRPVYQFTSHRAFFHHHQTR